MFEEDDEGQGASRFFIVTVLIFYHDVIFDFAFCGSHRPRLLFRQHNDCSPAERARPLPSCRCWGGRFPSKD